MIWLILAGMTGAAIAALLWPLRRPAIATNAVETASVAIYRAQLAEISRDEIAGAIRADEADIARTEAARQLLASQQTPHSAAAPSSARRTIAVAFTLACCLASALLYLRIGSPALPDMPLAARRAPAQDAPAQEMNFASALVQIEAHLARSPDDLRGWRVVAPVYLRSGRVDDAVRAYGNVVRLDDTPDSRADFAEAQVYAAQGTVTADVRRDFEAAVTRDAKQAKARYYLGLAAEQDGNTDKARETWSALAADSSTDPALVTALRERIAGLDRRDTADAVAALPQDAQQAAIRGMVERLAGRLHDTGGAVDEWLRLVRAYRVIEELGKAREALAEARKSFGSDAAAITRLDALARELGLEG